MHIEPLQFSNYVQSTMLLMFEHWEQIEELQFKWTNHEYKQCCC